jgi:CheY-like chemotaxis protein
MGARILVADDSVTIQKVVELTFSKEDFVLIPVRSGEEAIRKAKEVQPDLILLDLVMPDKNGYEVCTALRAEPMLRAVPIIMLTGTFEAFDKEQGLRAGANDFLTKPFESQALISKVKQLLFARTVDLGGPAAPAPAATVAPPPPPTEAPRPAPPKAVVAPAVPGVPPIPRPARPITPPVAAPAPPPPPAPAAAAKAGEPSALELPGLELEPIPAVPKPAGADASPFPQSLSLEELLAPGPVPPQHATPPEPPSGVTAESAPEPAPEPGSLEGPRPADEPVFDLTADMQGPSLPLVEVGTGEPPALAIEDLLRPPGAAPLESGIEEVPELQLEPFVDSKPEAAVPSPEVPPAFEPTVEIPPEPPRTATPSAGPVEIGDLVRAAAAAPPAVLMAEILATQAPPEGAEIPPAPPAAALGPEMGTLRQAVTERVAHELAKELSNQLIERIERIVWEVVPDLAEILINREIERIRTMAEGKLPS